MLVSAFIGFLITYIWQRNRLVLLTITVKQLFLKAMHFYKFFYVFESEAFLEFWSGPCGSEQESPNHDHENS